MESPSHSTRTSGGNKIVTPAMHAATSIRDVPGEMRAVVRSIVTLPMIATARKSDGIAQSPLRVASDMKATVPRISGMRAGALTSGCGGKVDAMKGRLGEVTIT